MAVSNLALSTDINEILRAISDIQGESGLSAAATAMNRYGVTYEQYFNDMVSAGNYERVFDVASDSYVWRAIPEDVLAARTDYYPGNYNTITPTINSAGNKITGQTITHQATVQATSSAGSAFNSSNAAGAATKVKIQEPVSTSIDAATNAVKVSPVKKFLGGVEYTGTGFKTAAGSVLPALAAASTGIALGKTIDTLLYKANPDFWDNNTLFGGWNPNPELWKDITAGDSSLSATLFNAIFGITPDAETGENQLAMYLPEDAAAYMAWYMQNAGVFDSADTPYIDGATTDTGIIITPTQPFYASSSVIINSVSYVRELRVTSGAARMMGYITNAGGATIYIASDTPFAITVYRDGAVVDTINVTTSGTLYGRAVYRNTQTFGSNPRITSLEPQSVRQSITESMIQYLLAYGTVTTPINIEGISTQDGATLPDFSATDASLAGYTAALRSQYPDLYNNRIEQDIVQADGTESTVIYYPLPIPTSGTGIQPTTNDARQNEPSLDPSDETVTNDLWKTIVKILTDPWATPTPSTEIDPASPYTNLQPDTNGDPTGSGDTPEIIVPTGSASALWAIYNPTQSEINSFGAWLWSNDFVDQILKLFNDPMQAIIGLHKIFAPPPTGGAQNIKVGYLDSGVSANTVPTQYTTVDCGSVNLPEYFKSVFDYAPYTDVSIYLPFIGIVPLDVADVMRSTVGVKYKVDVYTGACLALVEVTRDGAGGVIYQYAGSAAVQYPLSSGSYMGIVSSIIGVAGGVAATVASGGALAPMAIGAAGNALNARTRVEHSGGFSGNAGAMGAKKPYLIISRPQTEIAANWQTLTGIPSNVYATIGSASGLTRVSDVILTGISGATDAERDEIGRLLREGVYV